MKRHLLLILLAFVLIFTGCSYIEHTEGADSYPNYGESNILPEDTTPDTKNIALEQNDLTEEDKSLSQDKNNNSTSSGDDTNHDTYSILNVHFIDVGQGDSILIQSEDQYMLIDAGERNKSNIVIDYLESIGVKKLDYLIGTHPHSDHIGGLADVIRHFDIGKIIMPNVVHTTKTFENVLDAISDKSLRITKPIIGNEFTIGSATFTIIAPNSPDYNNLNNYSVGIKLINGANSFVFTGDAEVLSENEMLNNGLNLDADVLKLGHHGSITSSSDSFLDAVKPSLSIISVGEGNKYGHPHVEILQTHKDRNIQLYRTDKQGTIILESDGKTIAVNKEPYEITSTDLDFTKQETQSVNDNKSENDKANNDSTTIIENSPDTEEETNEAKNINVHITRTGAKYHRSNCRHLKSDIVVTLQEALNKGLTPCKTCKPPTL